MFLLFLSCRVNRQGCFQKKYFIYYWRFDLITTLWTPFNYVDIQSVQGIKKIFNSTYKLILVLQFFIECFKNYLIFRGSQNLFSVLMIYLSSLRHFLCISNITNLPFNLEFIWFRFLFFTVIPNFHFPYCSTNLKTVLSNLCLSSSKTL